MEKKGKADKQGTPEAVVLDAVAMVRRIRDAQHAALADQPWEEQAAFYRERAAALEADLRREERAR